VAKYGTKLQEVARESLCWFYMAVLGVLITTLTRMELFIKEASSRADIIVFPGKFLTVVLD